MFLKTDGAGNLSFADGGITGLTTTATGTVMTLSDTAITKTVNTIVDNQKEIRFRETTANGTNYVGLKAPASLTVDTTFTLPSADGTSGQVLQTNGSGVLSFSSPSSDFVLLATTDASSSASVSFDGYFSSTYKNYVIHFSYMIPSSSSLPRVRYRRSNADVTASNYWVIANGIYGSTTASDWNTLWGFNNDSNFIHNQNISTTTSNGGITGSLIIYDPLNTTTYKTINFQFGSRDTNNWYTSSGSMQLRDATSALSGITFYYTSGNIASGNFKLYGIK